MNERQEIIKEYKLKIKNLKKHNDFYYNNDNPKISDAQFDIIKKEVLVFFSYKVGIYNN